MPDAAVDALGTPGELAALVGPKRLVDWIADQSEPVAEHLWAEIWHLCRHARRERTKLMAARMFADRIDPVPRPPAVQVETGPIAITWKSSSPTPPDASRLRSTTPSEPIALGPASSSATDVLASL